MANTTGRETTTVELDVRGMTCGSCEKHVGEALGAVPGVSEVTVSRASGSATVAWAGPVPDVEALIDAVRSAGYDATVSRVSGGPVALPATPQAAARCNCCEVQA